jgi:hypothetical protein
MRGLMSKLRLTDDYGLTFIGFVVSLVTTFTVIVFASLYLVYVLDDKSCSEITESMNRDAYYGFWEGCMVETDDGYFPLDQVRENQ